MLAAPARGFALAAAVALLLSSASAQEAVPRESDFSSWAVSPAVVATFIGSREALPPPRAGDLSSLRHARSGPLTLDLLVLWRGAPGWFAQSGQTHDSGGGDSHGRVSVRLERGGLVLDVALDREKRVADVAGTRVALGDANVVLVDDVDAAGGPRIAGTRTVDPSVRALPEGLYDVFRGAPDLVAFLRCDARLPMPPRPPDVPPDAWSRAARFMQHLFDGSCAPIQGK